MMETQKNSPKQEERYYKIYLPPTVKAASFGPPYKILFHPTWNHLVPTHEERKGDVCNLVAITFF